jgi:hypothetical protein
MAAIRKLKSGRYNVQVRREGHLPTSGTFSTKLEAKARATKIEGDIDQGKHYGYSRVRTLGDAIDAFTKHGAKIATGDRARHSRGGRPSSATANSSTSTATWSRKAESSWPLRTSKRRPTARCAIARRRPSALFDVAVRVHGLREAQEAMDREEPGRRRRRSAGVAGTHPLAV